MRRLLLLAALALLPALAAPASAAVGDITIFRAGFQGGGANAGGMALGSDGNIWFTSNGRTVAIGRITPSGAYTYFRSGLSPSALPLEITLGGDGNLWFNESGTETVGRITPDGTIAEVGVGVEDSNSGFLTGIAAGADGNLWVSARGGPRKPNRMIRLTTAGAFTDFPVPVTSPAMTPTSSTRGPDGNVWVIDPFAPQLIRVDGGGGMVAFPLGAAGAGTGLTAAPDGNLWVTTLRGVTRVTMGGAVTEFSDGVTPVSGTQGIAADGDGNLWFVEANVSKIARVTPLGVVTEYPLEPGSGPRSIARGSDGNMWFSSGAGIGRILTGVAPPAPPPPAPPIDDAARRAREQALLTAAAELRARRVVVTDNRAVGVPISNPNAVVVQGQLTLIANLPGAPRARSSARGRARRRGRARAVTVASARFSLAPRATRTVRATLTRSAWRRLRRAGRLRVTVTIVLRAGDASKTTTKPLTLVAARARRRG